VPIQRLTQLLKAVSLVLGAGIVVYGFSRFQAGSDRGPLMLGLAVLVVGPLEDLLKLWARRAALSDQDKEAWAALIDQATSAVFLLFLLQAMAL
jgi:hypothetical protein